MRMRMEPILLSVLAFFVVLVGWGTLTRTLRLGSVEETVRAVRAFTRGEEYDDSIVVEASSDEQPVRREHERVPSGLEQRLRRAGFGRLHDYEFVLIALTTG